MNRVINILAWLTPYIIGAIVSRILFALTAGVASYYGINQLFGSAMGAIQDYIAGLPADMIALMGIAKIDIFINLVFSGFNVALMFFVGRRLRLL